MHVLVATPQLRVPHHQLAPLDGELVHLPAGVCDPCRDGAPCGWCEDAFTGVASHRPTSIAEVADRDLTEAMVIEAVADSLLDGNLYWGAPAARRRARDLAHSLVTGLLVVAGGLPIGTVIERQRGHLLVRSRS